MRITLIGPGNYEKIPRFGKISKNELNKLIKDLGVLLAKKGVEIILVPAKGVAYLIAQEYKKNKGKKIIGTVPRDDIEYGIAYIEEYLPIMDKEINIGNWYDLNGKICSLGDIVVCVGFGCGTISDIAELKYHYKYHDSKTKVVIFENTISKRLHNEIAEDLKYVEYINSIDELEKIIDNYKE